MKTGTSNGGQTSVVVETLEGRWFLSGDAVLGSDNPSVLADATPQAVAASRHHKHHVHRLHHLYALHVQRRQASHQHHLHTVHAQHHDHYLHTQHRAHVLRTTIPEPVVLTAQQRNDWATIREEFLANRKRVPK